MKHALIIHGFGGASNGNWFPWLTWKLQNKGLQVINETFPNPEHPQFETIMTFYRNQIKDWDQSSIIIGHSLGALFALKLAEEKNFKNIFLVAPAVGDLPFDHFRKIWEGSDVDSLERICTIPIDWKKIKSKAKFVFFSNNDPYIPQETIAKQFDKTWKKILLKNRGHIQDFKFPELLKKIENS